MAAPAREYEIIDLRVTDKKADGTELVTKTGKKMWRVGIQIADRKGTWINGLVFSDPSNWKGTKQKLILDVEEYQGKSKPVFKVVSPPRPGGFSDAKLDEVILLLKEIRDALKTRVEF